MKLNERKPRLFHTGEYEVRCTCNRSTGDFWLLRKYLSVYGSLQVYPKFTSYSRNVLEFVHGGFYGIRIQSHKIFIKYPPTFWTLFFFLWCGKVPIKGFQFIKWHFNLKQVLFHQNIFYISGGVFYFYSSGRENYECHAWFWNCWIYFVALFNICT